MTALQRLLPARGATAVPDDLDELRRLRAALAERVATMTCDLGGLVFEMAIRDHFRLDVLVRRAAALQEIDAELGAIERILAAADGGVAGQCRACGAVHARGAVFCWRCGQPLMAQAPSAQLALARPA